MSKFMEITNIISDINLMSNLVEKRHIVTVYMSNILATKKTWASTSLRGQVWLWAGRINTQGRYCRLIHSLSTNPTKGFRIESSSIKIYVYDCHINHIYVYIN